MKSWKRLMALFMAVFLMAAASFSLFFMAAEANHECHCADCPICEQITLCQQTVRSLGSAVAAVAAATVLVFFEKKLKENKTAVFGFHSLVSLKVKLSN